VTLDELAGFDMEAPFKFAWALPAEPFSAGLGAPGAVVFADPACSFELKGL